MKFLPIVLAIVGLGAGLGAGGALAPKPEKSEQTQTGENVEQVDEESETKWPDEEADQLANLDENVDYVRLNNQFVVPIVEQDRVASLIVMSLALETEAGSTDLVFQREPKLRDEFLSVLFTHARSGGFTGTFTDAHLMRDLRTALLRSARRILGDRIKNVLLIEIVRQDL
ncbi:MAG: flagellar basal body-associated FliL family protein [Pseudomonadota bacterium]